MTPAVNDFAAIAAALRAREAEKEKKPVEVTEGQPAQWVDTVYGMYATKPPEDVTSVWSSNQTGNTLSVNPLSRELEAGTVLCIEEVFAFSRLDGEIKKLQQFVVTANAEVGHRLIHLYPALLHFNAIDGGLRTTVDAPKNNARVFVYPSDFSVPYQAPESDPA